MKGGLFPMMAMKPGTAHSMEIRRGVLRWSVKQIIFLLILSGALFLSAGRLNWLGGWLFLGVVVLIQVITVLILLPNSPELLAERSQVKIGSNKIDLLLALLMAYSSVFIAIVAGLDVRFGWSFGVSLLVMIAAMLIATAGSLLTLWAMAANRFFSGVVRIQKERGHEVVMAGPYRFIRHPGYTGAIIFTFAAPFILNALWSLIPAFLTIGITFLRTAMEDRTLQNELEGYNDYTKMVRYRLMPYIW